MRELPISRGRYVVLLDDEDYDRIAAFRWHRRADGYAIRYAAATTTRIRMHREVLGVPRSAIVDHANGNPLDNRRGNLRICTPSENAWNSRAIAGQRVKGVQPINSQWRARIRIEGRLTHLGMFATEVEAALAYDAAARRYFGEFACVNFPLAGERPALVA